MMKPTFTGGIVTWVEDLPHWEQAIKVYHGMVTEKVPEIILVVIIVQHPRQHFQISVRHFQRPGWDFQVSKYVLDRSKRTPGTEIRRAKHLKRQKSLEERNGACCDNPMPMICRVPRLTITITKVH